jgi:hypothetical protein
MNTIAFKYHPAEDESVDAEYILTFNGADTGISIQVCTYGGGYAVNAVEQKTGVPDSFTMCHLGEVRTLTRAKQLAVEQFTKRNVALASFTGRPQ